MRPTRTEAGERYIRFYRWSQAEFKREVDEGYPLLRSMQSVSVMAYLRMMRQIPLEEQALVAEALVKRAHPIAAALVGETLTEEESAFKDDRLKYFNTFRGDFMTELRARTGEGCDPTDRGRFKAIVIEALTPVLGGVMQRRSRLDWCFLTPIGDYQLTTHVDLSSTWSIKLRYFQSITASDGSNVPLTGWQVLPIAEQFNILTCLGIGQAEWDTPFVRDMQPAADSLANICTHFRKALPTILEP